MKLRKKKKNISIEQRWHLDAESPTSVISVADDKISVAVGILTRGYEKPRGFLMLNWLMSLSSWTSPERELSPGRLENQFYLNLRRKPRLRVGISFLLLYNKIPQNRDLNHISYLGPGGSVPQVLPRSSAQSLARLQSRCQLVQKSLVKHLKFGVLFQAHVLLSEFRSLRL